MNDSFRSNLHKTETKAGAQPATTGISGLLPLVLGAGCSRTVSLVEFKGRKVAVDAYSWLHKGSFSCSLELCQHQPTNKYIQYCLNMVHLLLHAGVKPVLVFDGAPLPAKRHQEEKRKENREKNLISAQQNVQKGDMKTATNYFQKAVDVTPHMAHLLILALRQLSQFGVECIVAPHEADAQMAYLARNGLVDAVLTEDSDMIPYFCPCVIFKLDKATGTGTLVKLEDVLAHPQFQNLTKTMLRQACILSGCDYLPSIPGVGLKTAVSKMSQYQNVLQVITQYKEKLSANYIEEFKHAELTFDHQYIYDPISKCVKPLTPVPDTLDEQDRTWLAQNVGCPLPADLAVSIANGDVDPVTRQSFTSTTTQAELVLLKPLISNERSVDSHTFQSKKNESPLRPRPGSIALLPMQYKAAPTSTSLLQFFLKTDDSSGAKIVPPTLASDDTDENVDEDEDYDGDRSDTEEYSGSHPNGFAPPLDGRVIVRSKFFTSSPPSSADSSECQGSYGDDPDGHSEPEPPQQPCGGATTNSQNSSATFSETSSTPSSSTPNTTTVPSQQPPSSPSRECNERNENNTSATSQSPTANHSPPPPSYTSLFTTPKRISLPRRPLTTKDKLDISSFLDKFMFGGLAATATGSHQKPTTSNTTTTSTSTSITTSTTAAQPTPPSSKRPRLT
ncbi:exonuclease 1 [Pelomyxa schiedti]|nr:exonuclease 1 [Pelomyxa schiedti]